MYVHLGVGLSSFGNGTSGVLKNAPPFGFMYVNYYSNFVIQTHVGKLIEYNNRKFDTRFGFTYFSNTLNYKFTDSWGYFSPIPNHNWYGNNPVFSSYQLQGYANYLPHIHKTLYAVVGLHINQTLGKGISRTQASDSLLQYSTRGNIELLHTTTFGFNLGLKVINTKRVSFDLTYTHDVIGSLQIRDHLKRSMKHLVLGVNIKL